jgi:hypothetical protein
LEVKPNFCNKCGVNLSTGKVNQPLKPVTPEIEIIQKPNISSLNWDIEINKPKGSKLKDLAKGEKENVYTRDGDQSSLSKEDFLKQFQKEAGTLRRGSQSDENDDNTDDEDDT